MLRFDWALGVALGALVVGCAASHSRDGDPLAFWDRMTELGCPQITRCATGADGNAWFDAAPDIACRDLWRSPREAPFDPSRVRFDPTLVDACLEVTATSCHLYFPVMCPGVITGLQVAGMPCRDDLECVDGTFCSFDADPDACEGRCTARPTSGPCVTGCGACASEPGSPSRCLPRGPRVEVGSGERCDRDDVVAVCPAMHYCVETCRPFPGEGEPCGDYWPICAPGLGCSGGTCRPTSVVAEGEPCDDVLVFCDRYHGVECASGRCAPIRGCDGAFETVDCGPDAKCDDDGVCVPRAPLGAPCRTFADDCAVGARCIDEICVPGC